VAEDPARPIGSQASAWAVSYARTPDASLAPAPAGKVRVELLTDPYSVWCWGFEPVRRALEHRYPSVEFRPLLGGMFERLPDPQGIGFDVERFFAAVQRTTGMPIRGDAATRDRATSTYPACVHVHAARLVAPDRERTYLRALREAVYLDARNVSRVEVAADVAASVGIDEDEFREAVATGEPEREFRGALAGVESLNLRAYPTLLVTWGERTARVEGFQSLPALLGVVQFLTGTLLVPAPPPLLAAALPAGERVATREVAEVLGVSMEDAHEQLLEALRRGDVTRERYATGDVWLRRE